MKAIVIFRYLSLLISSVFLPTALADEHDSDLPQWASKHLEPTRQQVGTWVDSTSRSIDNFFGTQDSMRVDNESYLRVDQTLRWKKSSPPKSEVNLRYRIDLPTAEERLRLIIESDPEESQGTLEEQGSERLANARNNERSSIAGLSWLENRDKRQHWNNDISAGVRLHLPLNPYVRFTSERLWALGESPWQLESHNRVSWFNSDGYSARSRWDAGRSLGNARHLRFITTFQWREEEDTLEFNEVAELNHRLNERSALRHSAVAVGKSASDPRLTNYYLQTRYRRDVHKGILFADVLPALHFPRESDYVPHWAMTLRLEMYFQRRIERNYF